MSWDKALNSLFNFNLYFYSLKEQAGWNGTAQSVTVRDAEFGRLRIRTFGSYSFRIDNVPVFAAELAETMWEAVG